MSEELKLSGTSRGRDVLEQIDLLVANKPTAWGDGQILAWLIANGPLIIKLAKTLWAVFVQPTPAPTPTPGPVA